MFAAQERLSQRQRECAVFGYVRENAKTFVTNSVSKLCLQFYDPELHWKIDGDLFKTKFLSHNFGTRISSKTMHYHNIEWHVFAVDIFSYCPGYIGLSIWCTKIPNNIK